MPVSITLHTPKNLVCVRYSGFAEIAESMGAFEEYMRRPDYRSGRDMLVDMSKVTSHEKASPDLIRHHALMTEIFDAFDHKPLIVFYAPTRVAQSMALVSARPWDQLDTISTAILEKEIDVLELLGVTEPSIERLLEKSS
ncbi:hypothetical protein [Shimia sp. SDUM112013]|uniref:hypothetical protein n=1 Tax=Shimia sp. SDUM112013 TaxID=3136160 RepID=UPI0032EFEED4